VEHLNDTEKQLKQKMAEAAAHQHAGRMAEADAIRQQLQPMFLQFKKMKMFMDQYRAKLQQEHRAQLAANQNAPNAPPPGLNNVSAMAAAAPAALAPTVNFPSEQTPQGQPTVAPPIAGPSGEPLVPPTQGPPQTLNKAQDAQFQKLVEQQQRRTPRMGDAIIPPSQPLIASSPSQVQGPSAAGVPRNGQWEGVLTWRGLEPTTHVRTELQTKVTLTSPSNPDLNRQYSWPIVLTLTPSKERAIPWFLMQDWLKRTNGIAFMLQPRDSPGDDKAKNEDHFRQLIRLLTEKKIYALSGWQINDGKEHRVMIFPTKGGLAGGYFADGLPEMPATHICEIELDSIPAPMAFILSRLPQQQIAQLSMLPLDKRKQWLQAMALQQQQMMAQKMAAQGQQAVGGTGGVNLSGAGGMMTPGMDGAGGGMAMAMGAGMGQHQRSQSGGAINNEMLQSFMNRSGQQ